jgi:PIN domain nuclease of toxin-antitoxin system
MSYLLDTHILIWIATNKTSEISRKALEILNDNTVFKSVSIISLWEILMKLTSQKTKQDSNSIGWIDIDGGITEVIKIISKSGLIILPIKIDYLKVCEDLPIIHKDPYDRMLIATAKAEDMTLITADEKIHQYNVKTLWK